ncbi:uncharacterized protein MELLADRAFT_92364 [Melampsora larici-populina 98AG31]|uniref:Uncharacterized protein n=1 Tax=Melampsora larici-populina (strain 98AG31 / pathotype 3-4-7) TaxID=747676 RepID=F4R9D0_MELLP|nr:uncharacterized protein MELLADRAFT_92364 [Melampsora larici-populina 98AG31]EGG11176.1 hypothetical protein MELLADRAFT_92364 [Melampsora larici-populina 98AG31]
MTNQKQSRYATRSSTRGHLSGVRKVQKTSESGSKRNTSDKIDAEVEQTKVKSESIGDQFHGDTEVWDTPTPSYRAISTGSNRPTPEVTLPERPVLVLCPLEFPVDGSFVIFPALCMIMDATTLEDYL